MLPISGGRIPTTSPVTFRLELLGGFRLVGPGPGAERPLGVRQQQLLAYLALHDEGPIRRQVIAGHLWTESTDGQALTNLRNVWHHLRSEWPGIEAVVDSRARTLALRPSVAEELDVRAFVRAAERGLRGDRGALEEAARIYRGELLPDCLDAWIQPIRERLRQQAVAVLERLIQLHEGEQDPGAVIGHARRLLQIDPYHEPGWCALMRAHARRGERATALHVYQECASVLRNELGVQPGAATTLAYREILDRDTAASVSVPVLAAPAPRTFRYALVGRQEEWATLLRVWQSASGGRQQFLVIRGEPGIGKTRLADELVEWLRARGIRALTTRSYAADGRVALAPVSAWLRHDAMQSALSSLDGLWLSEIARLQPEILVTRPEVPAPAPQLEPWGRAHFFEALSRACRAAAPLLLVLDDVQWSDADTLQWLHYVLRSTPDFPCLIVATARTDEEDDNPALGTFIDDLTRLERVTTMTLGPLDALGAAQLAEDVAERSLDPDAQARMFRLTEGHPLFIVEQGRMAQSGESAAEVRSPRVQAVVEARLARLSDDAASVAQIAAAVGRDFTFDIVSQVSDLEEDALVCALDELWRRQLIRVHARAGWDFTHDRLREGAYETMGPARRRLIHRRIALALERWPADDLDTASASMALHFERGGQPLRAIPCLERAAQAAMRVSANEEAIRCLSHALALVDQTMTGRDRDERELTLRVALSAALTSVRGFAAADVEHNIRRVVALAGTLGRRPVPVRWLWGLWAVQFCLGDLRGAREVATLAFDQSRSDPSCLCEAHQMIAGSLASAGELESARPHFEASLAAYDARARQRSAFGADLGVYAHASYAHASWLLGDADVATDHAEKAVALAQHIEHPYSQVVALTYAALTYQWCDNIPKLVESAQAAVALCDRYGFAYYGDWAGTLLGWVRGREGHAAEGIAVIERALNRLDTQRAQLRLTYMLALLAETHAAAGDRATAVTILDRAIAMALDREDRWWLPELYRQRSLLAPAAERARRLHEALSLACAQGSRSLARRIQVSLDNI